MLYLKQFTLPTYDDEAGFRLGFPPQLEMQCYNHGVYPFGIFPQKQLRELVFAPVTVFCGGNGSGKSTLLNVIAGKLGLKHRAPYNDAPCFPDFLEICGYETAPEADIPEESRIICSDDVFDTLLDFRAINSGIDKERERLFAEYQEMRAEHFQLRSMDDYDEFKRDNEAKRRTKSDFVSRRIPTELFGKSNGESAFAFFTREIRENALYLLDEPENSLSAQLQRELVGFLADSVRFYRCQFIISTHSPFLLSMPGAKIYDLDSVPAGVKTWTQLENVRAYYNLFRERSGEFENG